MTSYRRLLSLCTSLALLLVVAAWVAAYDAPQGGSGGAASADLSAVDEDVLPDADSTRDLGSTSKRWAEVHGDTVYAASGEIKLGANLTLDDFGGGVLDVLNADKTARREIYAKSIYLTEANDINFAGQYTEFGQGAGGEFQVIQDTGGSVAVIINSTDRMVVNESGVAADQFLSLTNDGTLDLDATTELDAATSVALKVGGTGKFSVSSTTGTAQVNLLPSPDNTRTLGSSSFAWATLDLGQYARLKEQAAAPSTPASGSSVAWVDSSGYPRATTDGGYKLVLGSTWQDITVTGSWSTNTTYTTKARREGCDVLLRGIIVLSGAPDSANLYVQLPASLNIDPDQWPVFSGSSTPRNFCGNAYYNDSGTTLSDTMWVAYSYDEASSLNRIEFLTTNANVSATAPHTWANADSIHWYARVAVLSD